MQWPGPGEKPWQKSRLPVAAHAGLQPRHCEWRGGRVAGLEAKAPGEVIAGSSVGERPVGLAGAHPPDRQWAVSQRRQRRILLLCNKSPNDVVAAAQPEISAIPVTFLPRLP
jgi:hypothetical protein